MIPSAVLRYGLIGLSMLTAGLALTVWLLYGQVGDARSAAGLAKERVQELATTVTGFRLVLDDLVQRQQTTNSTLAARADEDMRMQTQLSVLRGDLNKVMKDDPNASAWGASAVPDALIDRVWGAGLGGAKRAPNNSGGATSIVDR